MLWFWILPVLFVIVWLTLLLEWNKHKYRQFHGESTLPIFGNALQLGFNSYDIYQTLNGFSKKYDRFFRLFLGPTSPWIVLKDPDDIEVVLTNQKNITKGDAYQVLKKWLGQGLLTSTGDHWHRHRKLLTPAFHFGILERFVEVFENNGEVLVNKLAKHADKSSFDVYNYVSLCALDNMIDATMGISLNVQKNEENKYLVSVRKVSKILFVRMCQPWFYNDNVFELSTNGKLHDQYVKIIQNFTEEIIQKRKSIKHDSKHMMDNEIDDGFNKKRLALLDLLLDIQDKDPSFTDVDVREETDTFIFEGHDTTTSAISFCLYNISRNPEVQKKIVAELDTIFENKTTKATYRDLQNMVYLEKVIKESLRTHPSVPTISRMTSTDLYLKDNIKIPMGTEVALFFSALGMNPKVWPNPERFDPDRFDLENSRARHPFAFSMFSAGPRNCIGQKFAILEIKSTVSKVLRNFVVKDAGHELKLTNDLTLKSMNGVLISLEERI